MVLDWDDDCWIRDMGVVELVLKKKGFPFYYSLKPFLVMTFVLRYDISLEIHGNCTDRNH